MITTNKLDLRLEALKLLILAILAAILLLTMVGTVTGAAPRKTMGEPGLLPAEITGQATPIQPLPQLNHRFELEPRMPAVTPEMHYQLWLTLQLHREDRPAEALLAWEKVVLPPHTAVYKPTAMAVAEMRQKNLKAAEALLRDARNLDPDNALVAYYTGVLRMEQAAACEQVDPDIGAQFVAAMPWEAPEQRAMYELAAIMEFRDAIERAATVHMDDELMPDPQATNLGPLVGDLVRALKADNFVGKAHHALGDLLLRRGMLREAEEHMDAAAEMGLTVMFGYEDLGLLYELQGRPADTLRAYRKNFAQRHPEAARMVERALAGMTQ